MIFNQLHLVVRSLVDWTSSACFRVVCVGVLLSALGNCLNIEALAADAMAPQCEPLPQRLIQGVFVDPGVHGPLPPLRRPMGPDELPVQFQGAWKVSICTTRHHAWIRFENVESSETHTLGRFVKGVSGLRDSTGKQITPDVGQSGVYMDMDLMFEDEIRRGRCILLSVVVENPMIYRGANRGFGYTLCRRNCTSFARSAWEFYSGEHYTHPLLDMPEDFAYSIWRRHRNIPFAKRLGYSQ